MTLRRPRRLSPLLLAPLLLAQSLGSAPGALAGPTRSGVGDLERALAAQPSASLALTGWCRARGWLGPDETLRAIVAPAAGPPPASLRNDLALAPGEAVKARRVSLMCGARTVSRAENFYVPGRLSAAMNMALETSDTPFGLVVKSLGFTRRRIDSRRLAGARRCAALGAADQAVLRQRAVLVSASGVPFSEVVETYVCRTVRS